jgi:hypothetical protein
VPTLPVPQVHKVQIFGHEAQRARGLRLYGEDSQVHRDLESGSWMSVLLSKAEKVLFENLKICWEMLQNMVSFSESQPEQLNYHNGQT